MAFGADGDKSRTKGMIMTRTGESIIVNTPGGKVTVMLTDNTKTKDDRGLFGLEKQTLSSAVLIPGLKVDVEGTSDAKGRVVAKTITVDGDDLETSEMIQAGLHPTAEQVAANVARLEQHGHGISTNRKEIESIKEGLAKNKAETDAKLAGQQKGLEQNIAEHTKKVEQSMKEIQEATERFNALTDFETKDQATVKFASGSTKISTADQQMLKQLAQKATGMTGYIIEVMGYADATGDAEMNTQLSEDRAKGVVAFFVQQCKVPIRHIVAPGAMGEYEPAKTNETAAGRAENRRVEVKVLVNKAVSGS